MQCNGRHDDIPVCLSFSSYILFPFCCARYSPNTSRPFLYRPSPRPSCSHPPLGELGPSLASPPVYSFSTNVSSLPVSHWRWRMVRLVFHLGYFKSRGTHISGAHAPSAHCRYRQSISAFDIDYRYQKRATLPGIPMPECCMPVSQIVGKERGSR